MKNNPFGYSKTELNWIVSDVNILYRDNVEDLIAGVYTDIHEMG